MHHNKLWNTSGQFPCVYMESTSPIHRPLYCANDYRISFSRVTTIGHKRIRRGLAAALDSIVVAAAAAAGDS